MQKFGTLTLKESNQRYEIIWYASGTSYTRFDIVKSMEGYSIVDTSNAEASYIASKGRVRYLGDDKIIASTLHVISEASTFKAELVQEMSNADGKIRITQSKEDAKLGLRWYNILDFGLLTEEYYETPEALLVFDSIDKNATLEANPINMGMYIDYGSVGSSRLVDEAAGDHYTLDYLKAKYPLEHMKNYDFVVVRSLEEANERLRIFEQAPTKVKAIDLETTGLEWCMLGKDVLVGVVMSWNENESTYYPFRQKNFKYNLPMSFLQKILDVIKNQPKDVMIIGHNAKVEKQGVWKESKFYVSNSEYAREWDKDYQQNALNNPELRIDGDSMLLSILVDPEFYKGAHALKSLAAKYRKVFFLSLEDVFKDKKSIKFDVLTEDLVQYYACPDTANTICVWNNCLKELPTDELGVLDLENRMIGITAEMEFYGMRTKREYLLKAIENEEYIVKMLADMFKSIHKISANINSNDVRRDIFYNRLRAPIKVRTKTGAPATSNVALKAIIDSGKIKITDKTVIPPDIVDKHGDTVIKGKDLASNKYQSLVILAAYAKHFKELGALKRIERKSKGDRVYFSLNQAGASTGRATSDAHQYSDAMKKTIIADTDDYYLWSADFKQVELRILAFVAGQKDLIEMESNPDVDVHRAILSILSGKPIWNISAEERKKGKSTNFGVVYMMSPFGLAKKNKGPDYTDADYVDALESITGFYNGLPYIKAQTERNKYEATTYGVIRNRFGRRRYFKLLLDPATPEKKRQELMRAANNFPIQSFGADLLKLCQCNTDDYIKEKGWNKLVETDGKMMPLVRMMLPIHDEILVSSHKSIPIEEIITMFKVCMEVKIAGAPPFFSAPAMVGCWFDGKLDKYELDLRYRDEIVEAWQKGKHIIHSGTYDESLDWRVVEDLHKHCDKLRSDITTKLGVDVVKTILKEKQIAEDDKQAILDIIGDEKELLVKHYTKNGDVNLMIRHLLDEEFNWYLEDLSDYRNNRLKEYMDDLIRKYKTPEEVAKHVTHDELTHTLIAIKIKSDEKMSHTEAILEATRRYMNDNEVVAVTADTSDSAEDREYISDFEGLTKYFEFDENGEVIEPEDNEDESDEGEYFVDEIEVEQKHKRTYCTYMLNEVIIDLSDFDNFRNTAEDINQAVGRLHSAKEYYNVVYLSRGKLLKTSLRIGYIPEEIDLLIEQKKAIIGEMINGKSK